VYTQLVGRDLPIGGLERELENIYGDADDDDGDDVI
jgi:hypothetical protein